MSQTVLQALRQLRAGNDPMPESNGAALEPFDIGSVRQAVKKDVGLRPGESREVLKMLDDPNFLAEIKSGGVGAALSYMVARYLRLKPQNQLLLSIAGFGIGKIIYDYKHDTDNFSRYNPKLKMYELK